MSQAEDDFRLLDIDPDCGECGLPLPECRCNPDGEHEYERQDDDLPDETR